MSSPTRKRRSWSRYTERRVPTEYEFVSHDLHWHYKPGQTPWEMSPDHVWNRWYTEHRNDSPFRCSDWNAFRDPDMLVYRTYVRMQDEAETYVDGLIDDHEDRNSYAELSSHWLDALGRAYTPFRYAGHGLLMASTYVMSMAPSSYISNAVAFQGADELRRIQRIAYQTRQLQIHYPERGFGEDRAAWETAPALQPLRKAIETHLGIRDWGQSCVNLCFVLKPAIDAVFNLRVAEAAAANGDELTSMLHRNLQLDTIRSRRWSVALARTAIADHPPNRDLIQSWVDQTREDISSAVVDASALLSTPAYDLGPDETRTAVDEAIDAGLIGVDNGLDDTEA
ncbi:toluene hydroxylase [Pseudonocardia endophytica]|uniref:propane 2-monooxygenase n=1 Tax=Pseudonocardia endophytica TaxID=401976 RepID=A0A4R1I2R8_PSEEN|nr:toluene hydroxylase [Pseudonocardia endophytica]TCK27600.1 toluene monooxygenase system protein E [Pseudonocardia endophytica]